MKTLLTVSVDPTALALAKTKITNVSAYVNECLVAIADQPDTPLSNNRDELKKQLMTATSELAKIRQKIRKEEKERDPVVQEL